MFYRSLLRPLLYSLPPETAHHLAMAGLAGASSSRFLCALAQRTFGAHDPALRVDAFGLSFPSPIGLAAGLDKDGIAIPALGALGFGSIEVGTITAEPQPGNPRPRLFRLTRDRALINRMGFNNGGAERAAQRFAALPPRRVPLGINIGKTKVVPNEQALHDYGRSAALLGPFADYLVINVSSPNTPGLRDLQAIETLRPLLVHVRSVLDGLKTPRRTPLLLKIAPDLADADIDALADLALALQLDGLIATNTTIGRTGLTSEARAVDACGAGGLSGAPLKARAHAVLQRLYARIGERIPLVSVGGIDHIDDVWQRLEAGASLVQVYTGFIYEGPLLAARLSRQLAERLRSAELSSVAELRRRGQRMNGRSAARSGTLH